MADNELAVRTARLTKRFGTVRALRGVDLEMPAGTVYGLLGPNGAGKTTLMRILATLTKPDAGVARVGGLDVVAQAARVRHRIGLAGQYAAVDEKLTGRENLRMFARLSHLPPRQVGQKAAELLVTFDLTEAADHVVASYSGGMRRRLDLAASLLTSPSVLFLDEPTAGLDPRSRSEVWDAVRALAACGTTVLLTTHYLDEAEQLANRIAVIDHGRVIAEGTPRELAEDLGGARLEVVIDRADGLEVAAGAIARATGTTPHVTPDARRIAADLTGPASVALAATARELEAAGLAAADLAVRRPTLDEVFLRLTGEPSGKAEAEVAT